MQQDLAQRLLSATLDWNAEQIEEYRETIEDLSDYKYNQYQQYKPSSRFIEHLSIWLNQFDSPNERKLALEFILKNLVFISPAEMLHLIDTAYHEVIEPLIIEQAVSSLVTDNEKLKNKIYTVIKRSSLFLALSDGARIDAFRRASKLNHDQVCVNYDLSETKFSEILQEMKHDTESMISDFEDINKQLFQTPSNIFLIDDFSGSGISYLRFEEGQWKGKIIKVLNCLYKEKILNLSSPSANNPNIFIVLYLATNQAIDSLKNNIEEYTKDKNLKISINTVQTIEQVHLSDDEEKWLMRYYNNEIEDSHYKKGNVSKPYLGFDGCSLALVLYHNTPNNSFPILWHGDNALFPRITRHKDVI